MNHTICDTRVGNHARQTAQVNRIGWLVDPPHAPRTRRAPATWRPLSGALASIGALLTTRNVAQSS